MAELDARYPRLASYLAGLPAGLESYPQCICRRSLATALLDGMPAPRPRPEELPEPARRLLLAPPRAGWIPEVEVMALSLVIADHCRMTDERYLGWIRDRNRGYLSGLLLRALFAFLSPAALMPRAGARWAAIHRGSALEARILGPGEAEAVLSFPPGLFAPVLLRHFTGVFQAALDRSNARTAEVRLVEHDAVHARYLARWS